MKRRVYKATTPHYSTGSRWCYDDTKQYIPPDARVYNSNLAGKEFVVENPPAAAPMNTMASGAFSNYSFLPTPLFNYEDALKKLKYFYPTTKFDEMPMHDALPNAKRLNDFQDHAASLAKAATRALSFLSGLQLQDQPRKAQTEALAVIRELMAALKPGRENK